MGYYTTANKVATLAAVRAKMAPMLSRIGNPTIDDPTLWSAILAAEATVVHTLRVLLVPTQVFAGDPTSDELSALAGAPYYIEPAYDFEPIDRAAPNWSMFATRQRPIIAFQSMRFVYPVPGATVLDIPADWIRVDRKYGVIQLVPAGALSVTMPLSAYMMQIFGSGRTIPQIIRARYTAGLADVATDYPDLLAAIQTQAMLNQLMDTLPGTSESISGDGLSQSISQDMSKYQDWVDDKLSRIKTAIFGVQMIVV